MNKFHSLAPFAIFVVLSLVVIGPTMWGYIYSGGDTVTYAYPAAYVHASHDSSINPLYLAGFPTVFSPIGDYLDPVNRMLLDFFSDSFTAIHIRFGLALFLGLMFSYLFSVRSGLSRQASLIVALGYLVAQPLFYTLASANNAGAFFVFPALLYVAISMRQSWWGHLIFGALLVWWAWVSGFVQIVFYSALLAGIFALYLDYSSGEGWSWMRWRSTAHFAIAGLMGTLLAIPFFAVTNELREVSLRTDGFGSDHLDGIELVDIVHFFVPDYVVVPFFSTTLSAGFYVGALSILCIIITLPLLWRERHSRFFLVSYAALFLILCVPLGIGALIQHLPGFSLFHTMKRVMLPGSFLLAYLGGYALDAMYARRMVIGTWSLVLAGAIVSAIVMGVLAANVFFTAVPWHESEWQDDTLHRVFTLAGKDTAVLTTHGEHYRNVFATTLASVHQQFSLLNWRFSVPVLILVLVFVLIVLFGTGRLSREKFMYAAVALVICNTGLVFVAQYDQYVPRATLTETPEIASLIRHPGRDPSNRVIGFLIGDAQFRMVTSKRILSAEEGTMLLRNVLGTNANFFFGIARLDGYEPFWPEREYHFFREVLRNEVFAVTADGTFEEQLAGKEEDFLQFLPLLSSFGVDHIISGYPLHHEKLSLVKAVNALPDFPVYVYRNARVRPLVQPAEKILIVPEWDDSLFAKFVSTPLNIIECSDCDGVGNGIVRIIGVEHTASRSVVSVESEGGWLIFSRLRIPGWEAFIDGVPTSTYYANYLMTALYVPKGATSVLLQYGHE